MLFCDLLADCVSLSCKTFYRDYDTLREVETTQSELTQMFELDDSTPMEMPIGRPSSAQRSLLYDATQYKAAGLKNLDIQIVPRIAPAELTPNLQAADGKNSQTTVAYPPSQGAWKLKEGEKLEYNHAISYVNEIKVCLI